ncbi:hypothetical protein ACFWBF_13970 [Streptomyces sp. NPDC060028]|uniref:hypothetical protein n=1 Tax=Streptomyces sp. NPDC060028 TaxID=3347041 RepID=UPI0036C3B6B6
MQGAAAARTIPRDARVRYADSPSRRHPAPAVDRDLGRDPVFARANVGALLFGAAMYAWLLTDPSYLIDRWHYSVLQAGFGVPAPYSPWPAPGIAATAALFTGAAAAAGCSMRVKGRTTQGS